MLCLGQRSTFWNTLCEKPVFICIACHFELRTYSVLVNFRGNIEQLRFRILFNLNLRLHRVALKDLRSTVPSPSFQSQLITHSSLNRTCSFFSVFKHFLFLCVIPVREKTVWSRRVFVITFVLLTARSKSCLSSASSLKSFLIFPVGINQLIDLFSSLSLRLSLCLQKAVLTIFCCVYK